MGHNSSFPSHGTTGGGRNRDQKEGPWQATDQAGLGGRFGDRERTHQKCAQASVIDSGAGLAGPTSMVGALNYEDAV